MQNESKIIEQLAEKLGVASESIWTALLMQARIDSIWFLVIFIALVAAFVMSITWARKESKERGWVECDNPLPIIIAFIVGVFLFVMILCLPSELAGIYNPEYKAVRSLFNH